MYRTNQSAGLRCNASNGALAGIRRRALTGVSAGAVGLALQLAVGGAYAQTEPGAQPPGGIEQVTVTGSRIQNSNYAAPTPLAVVSSDVIQQNAITSTVGVLALLPQQLNSINATNAGNNIQGSGLAGANLRALGGSRTLVLVNGQRFMPTSIGTNVAAPAGTVDLNEIPASLIKRVEVITGGASASWGSDAVAGVVNIILDNEFTGTKAQAQYSVTQYGDGGEQQLSFTHGEDFADGRGHFTIAAEFLNNQGAGSCFSNFSRDWCSAASGYNLISNPTPGVNGYPARLYVPRGVDYRSIIPNSPYPTLVIGGIVPSGPLTGYSFDANSNPYKFTAGTIQVPPEPGFPKLENPEMHYTLYGHATYNVFDDLQASLDVTYADVRTKAIPAAAGWSGATVSGPLATQMHICDNPGPATADGYCAAGEVNPYLTPATLALMATNHLTSLPLDFNGPQFGYSNYVTDRDLIRVVPGISGSYRLFGQDWTWNAYDEYAHSFYTVRGYNSYNTANFNLASHAVTVTPANVGSSGLAIGSVACLSTLTNPSNGCQPVNYMGNVTPSQAAHDYITGTLTADITTTQNLASVSTSGTLFDLPAGPVSMAIGGEYRLDQVRTVEDPITFASGFASVAQTAATGGVNVKEGFLETEIPIVKDLPFTKLLTAQLAGRVTDYSTSGTVETWKLGAVDDINDWLRLRGTFSSDIRAPSLWELFSTEGTFNTTVSDPVTHNSSAYVIQYIGGNPHLKPEVASTITAGFVVTAPEDSIFAGLTTSLDYYKIDIKNAITAGLGSQVTVNQCYAGFALACSLVVRNPDNTIAYIYNNYVNAFNQVTAGYDLSVNYSRPLFDGVADVSIAVNHVTEDYYTSNLSGQTIKTLGFVGSASTVGGQREWNLSGSLTYALEHSSVTLRGVYISSGILNNALIGPGQVGYSPYLPNSTQFNLAPDAYYLYLSGTRDIWTRGDDQVLQLYGSIDNLLNKHPPLDTVAQTGTNGGPPNNYTNYAVYDQLGRTFRIGLRLKM